MYNLLKIDNELMRLEPAELARKIQECKSHEVCEILCKLPQDKAGRVLMEIPEDLLNSLIKRIPDDVLLNIIRAASPNIAADIIGKLDRQRRLRILEKIPKDSAAPIVAILQYPPDTAGGIMTDRFLKLYETDTISAALERIRKNKEWKPDDVSYMYVVDKSERLVGVAQVHQILFGDSNRLVKDIVKREVKFLRVDASIDEIQHQFALSRFLGLPVVDEIGRLVGVVRAADVLQLAEKEATRDMQLMVGLSGVERLKTPWKMSIKQRLPWLYFNLITSFLAAIAVGIFQDTLAKWIALAVFMPVILSQGANAGLQTLTIVVREMALGELIKGDEAKALAKEFIVGIVCGIAAAILVGAVGYFWKGGWFIGLIAGTAIVLNQLIGAVSGVLIPLVLRLIKIDPALASSVILTTVTDVAGVIILLGGATLIARFVAI
ncbi:MAG: magnesium transporter [Verrucomicrobiae bacterium]|nr:magnesium transporter [Verrucomicrobiae bacterium]